MPSPPERCLPVLLVGAGPTGLSLAAALTRYGVPVRLIERRRELSRHTKATNLMQRTQEILHAMNLLTPLTAAGGQMTRLMVHAYGKAFGPSTMHLRETPFQDVILCGQDRFEAVVAAGLRERGVEVEFGSALEHLAQTATEVQATVASEGRTERIACSFVVGCDGGEGTTRTFTKNDFRPVKSGIGIRQVDCTLRWRRSSTMDQMWLFYFDHGFAAIVPLPGGVHRLLTIEPKDAIPAREPTLQEMQDAIRRIAADRGVELSEPRWFSYTDLAMGIAPGLRDGRILLAGDSGNPILPNGGQGMNTGIGDSFNLGWKLASVLLHDASDGLLDTYDRERHALRTALQNAQYQSLKYTTQVTPKTMQTMMKAVGPTALKLGGEYKMAQAFSQLTISTRKSALTLETMRTKGVRAGDRALDEAVVCGRETVRLYDLIYAGSWTLLAFGGAGRQAERALSEAIRTLARPEIVTYRVLTTGESEDERDILYDLDEAAHRAYGVRAPTLYLVRPDGHVGARVAPAEVAALKTYAAQWVPRQPLRAAQGQAPGPTFVGVR